jgi:hypothetical protein
MCDTLQPEVSCNAGYPTIWDWDTSQDAVPHNVRYLTIGDTSQYGILHKIDGLAMRDNAWSNDYRAGGIRSGEIPKT